MNAQIVICDDIKEECEIITKEIDSYMSRRGLSFNADIDQDPLSVLNKVKAGIVPDICLLDVEMPRMDGFELAGKLREADYQGVIIFLTSHTELAAKGYKSRALRYVSKLDLPRELPEALDAAFVALKDSDNVSTTLEHSGGIQKIFHRDIVYVRREQKNIIITKGDGTEIRYRISLRDFYDLLSDGRFFIIDKGCFVNLDYISGFSKTDAELINGETLPVSRRSLQPLKVRLAQYWGMEK